MNSVNKAAWTKLISAFLTVLGFFLLVYMITVESEPGLIPMILLSTGIAGLIIFRRVNEDTK